MPLDSTLLSQLITRIAALQSAGDQHYLAGLFPSQRRQKALGYCREDSNVFFTALTVYTLQDIASQLDAASQATVAAVAARARPTYAHYRSRDEQATYNYYQTWPQRRHFPHGRLLHRTLHFAPPDDADCTTLIYLADPRPAAENEWLKAKLRAHANTVHSTLTTGPAAFRQRKLYSVWFGRRMPVELDVSTLANTLLWCLRSGLPLNEFDHDSLAYIDWVITSGAYRRDPLGVSPYYATVPLIAYHVGRLAAEAPQLAASRAALLRELPGLLVSALPFIHKILLASTLLRLGATTPPLLGAGWALAELEQHSRGLHFCIAPLLNYYPPTRWLARWPLTHIGWECPAHSLALVAEYLVLGGR